MKFTATKRPLGMLLTASAIALVLGMTMPAFSGGYKHQDKGMGMESSKSMDVGTNFNTLDTNMDGYLNRGEASQSPVLSNQWESADANKDHLIDRSEFSAFEISEGVYSPIAPRYHGTIVSPDRTGERY